MYIRWEPRRTQYVLSLAHPMENQQHALHSQSNIRRCKPAQVEPQAEWKWRTKCTSSSPYGARLLMRMRLCTRPNLGYTSCLRSWTKRSADLFSSTRRPPGHIRTKPKRGKSKRGRRRDKILLGVSSVFSGDILLRSIPQWCPKRTYTSAWRLVSHLAWHTW